MKFLETKCFSSNALKVIAVISMLIDHIGFVFFPWTLEFRYIGRIAFPIYCFLLVEGFFYTKSVGKYLLRLGIFAIISEIPFNLGLYRTFIYTRNRNVFFTLFIGLAVIWLAEFVKKKTGDVMYGMFICMLGMGLAWYIHCDYSYTGILIIYVCYLTWEKRNYGTVLSRNLQMLLLSVFLTGIFVMHTGTIEDYAIFSIPFLWLYSGKKTGIIWEKLHLSVFDKFFKYFFYAFYPLHLLIIYIIFVMVWC